MRDKIAIQAGKKLKDVNDVNLGIKIATLSSPKQTSNITA